MGGQKQRDVPTPLAHRRDRFETWRRTRETGTRIPARLNEWKRDRSNIEVGGIFCDEHLKK